jgi:hypothetical protein
MNKSEVLETAGGPNRTHRKNGQDEWVYVIPGHQQDPDQIKSVMFTEGRVTSVGDPIKPLISAEEQDRINEEINTKLDAQDRAASLGPIEVSRKSSEPSVTDPTTSPQATQSTFIPLEDFKAAPPPTDHRTAQ